MSFLRVFFVFLILYASFKFIMNLFRPNKKGKRQWGGNRDSDNTVFYKDITDQKIEDAEYEDVETEKRK